MYSFGDMACSFLLGMTLGISAGALAIDAIWAHKARLMAERMVALSRQFQEDILNAAEAALVEALTNRKASTTLTSDGSK